jgi:hypothetical protein
MWFSLCAEFNVYEPHRLHWATGIDMIFEDWQRNKIVFMEVKSCNNDAFQIVSLGKDGRPVMMNAPLDFLADSAANRAKVQLVATSLIFRCMYSDVLTDEIWQRLFTLVVGFVRTDGKHAGVIPIEQHLENRIASALYTSGWWLS